uniref:PDZ domain-containing protein n=1 Tax=Labrus bergylta TaxID=56723 RepID=A0A3Q3GW04_9LABR
VGGGTSLANPSTHLCSCVCVCVLAGMSVSAIKDGSGMLVRSVVQGGSVSQDGRLGVGDAILAINGEPTSNLTNPPVFTPSGVHLSRQHPTLPYSGCPISRTCLGRGLDQIPRSSQSRGFHSVFIRPPTLRLGQSQSRGPKSGRRPSLGVLQRCVQRLRCGPHHHAGS